MGPFQPEFHVRPAEPADREAVLDLLTSRRSLRRGGPDRKARSAMWEWQFVRHPFRWRDPLLWVAEAGGQVIGTLGSVPALVAIRGRPHRALWAVDLYTHPEHRGKGVGRALLEAYSLAEPLTFGLQMAEATFRIFERMGYVRADLHMVHRIGLRELRRPPEKGSGRCRVVPLERLRGEADDLLTRAGQDRPAIFVRNEEFLRYRYFDHPLHRYVFLAALDGPRMAGYLVFRTSGKQGYLVDCLALAGEESETAQVLDALVLEALDRMGRTRVREVECWTTWTGLQRTLLGLGFQAAPEGVKFVCRAPAGLLPAGDPGETFFLSRGDSDGDYW